VELAARHDDTEEDFVLTAVPMFKSVKATTMEMSATSSAYSAIVAASSSLTNAQHKSTTCRDTEIGRG
jgi:hypothetical protein